jgi:cytochrome c oxidase cbb3-type subunit 3
MKRAPFALIILATVLHLSIISCTKEEGRKKEEIVVAEDQAKNDTNKGKVIYNQKCANCHGPTGRGDGPQMAFLDPKPTNLSDANYMSTLTDEHIFKTISEGGMAVGKSNLMPRWKFVLTKDDIWNVIAYIRQILCKCKYKRN